ncbi:hypothetical protein UM48_004723 [Salmonella enterica subsp. enterica]|nr:hypothetical protein [Salmonella enterica subsp. enterica]
MDFDKLIADGFINTVKDESGKIFYVWSDKVPREIVPNPDVIDGIYFDRSRMCKGKPCKDCGNTIRYQNGKQCVRCQRGKNKINWHKKQAAKNG